MLKVSTNALYCTVYFKPTIGMLHGKSVESLTIEREIASLITLTVLILKTTKQ